MEQVIRYSLLSQKLTDEEYQLFVCKLMQKFGRSVMNSFIFMQFNPSPIHTKPIQANIREKITSLVAKAELRHKKRRSQILVLTDAFNNIMTDIINEQRQYGNNDTFSIDSCIDIITEIIEERDTNLSSNYDNINSFPKECVGKIASFLDCTSYNNLQCSSRNLFLLTSSPITLKSICITSKQQANAFKIYKYPHISDALVNLRFFKQIIDTNVSTNNNILCHIKKLTLCSRLELHEGIHYFCIPNGANKIFDLTELHTLSLNGVCNGYEHFCDERDFNELLIKIGSMTKNLQYLYMDRICIEADTNYSSWYYDKIKQSMSSLFPSLKGLSLNNNRYDYIFTKCIPRFANQIESLRIDDGIPREYEIQSVSFVKLKELTIKLSSISNTTQNQIDGIIQATKNLERLSIDFTNGNNKICETLINFIMSNQSLNQIDIYLYNELHEVMPSIERFLSSEEIGQCNTLNISIKTTISGVIPTVEMFDTFADVFNIISTPIQNIMITLLLGSVRMYSNNVKYIENELESRISNVNWNILVSAKHFHHKIVITNKNYKIKDSKQIWNMSENDISYHKCKSTRFFVK